MKIMTRPTRMNGTINCDGCKTTEGFKVCTHLPVRCFVGGVRMSRIWRSLHQPSLNDLQCYKFSQRTASEGCSDYGNYGCNNITTKWIDKDVDVQQGEEEQFPSIVKQRWSFTVAQLCGDHNAFQNWVKNHDRACSGLVFCNTICTVAWQVWLFSELFVCARTVVVIVVQVLGETVWSNPMAIRSEHNCIRDDATKHDMTCSDTTLHPRRREQNKDIHPHGLTKKQSSFLFQVLFVWWTQ